MQQASNDPTKVLLHSRPELIVRAYNPTSEPLDANE